MSLQPSFVYPRTRPLITFTDLPSPLPTSTTMTLARRETSSSNGLNPMIAIGIASGATTIIACAILLIYCLKRKRRNRALSRNMQHTQVVKQQWFALLNPFSSSSTPKLPKMDRVSTFGKKGGDLEMSLRSIGRQDSACASPPGRSGLRFRDEYPISPVLTRELIVHGTGMNVRSQDNSTPKLVLLNGVPVQRFKATAKLPPRLPLRANPTIADEKERDSASTFETDVDELADVRGLTLVKDNPSVGTATVTTVRSQDDAKSLAGEVDEVSPRSSDSPFVVGDDEDEGTFEEVRL
ncbi:hypothetical protein K491DRAFT_116476 [Lophiostoma macrostomum CBS 122681]|uniref:Uncharacterized protein n=1 Tax=Lophiostoma macrostomum CBS 122681 TaxID=1314788 RepID=A0A6A6ST03_9PLEO|nr:hypothetical protein K491DRAFT_116476 [Lophiostoma macrostomum CBS 122681]